MDDTTIPQPDATPQASAPASTSGSEEASTPKASFFQNWIEKLKAGSKEKPKMTLYILLAVIVILIVGVIVVYGFVLAIRAIFTGDPNGNYTGANGECYMPDQYWTDPSAELTVDVIKQRVESYKSASNVAKDAELQKLLTQTRAAGN